MKVGQRVSVYSVYRNMASRTIGAIIRVEAPGLVLIQSDRGAHFYAHTNQCRKLKAKVRKVEPLMPDEIWLPKPSAKRHDDIVEARTPTQLLKYAAIEAEGPGFIKYIKA